MVRYTWRDPVCPREDVTFYFLETKGTNLPRRVRVSSDPLLLLCYKLASIEANRSAARLRFVDYERMPGRGGGRRRVGLFCAREQKRTRRRDEDPISAAGKVGGISIGNNLMDLLDLCDMGVEEPLDPARELLGKATNKGLLRIAFVSLDVLRRR